MTPALVWVIAAGTIAGIIFRPKGWTEAVWACLGAALLVVLGQLSLPEAGSAIGKGTDVYLFLTGMMLLSELARREGVFDWLASLAVRAAKRSRARLFGLIYLVGVVVTVFLSNDATAVVLTPAVYAAVQKARTKALPYLLICAFIANAASFVLPISNPANLVVYGKNLPPLVPWLAMFLVPSALSIGATYLALRWVVRDDLTGDIAEPDAHTPLSARGRRAAWGIVATGLILIGSSAFGMDLGIPTLLAAAAVILTVTWSDFASARELISDVSWTVLPLVAGLFVLVEAINHAGALQTLRGVSERCAALPRMQGTFSASVGIALISNLMNNLPSGLLAGGVFETTHLPSYLRNAALIGVDLGPNLSVTGSLATVLWLIAIRREGEQVSAWQFLRAGIVVTPPALLLATFAAGLLSR